MAVLPKLLRNDISNASKRSLHHVFLHIPWLTAALRVILAIKFYHSLNVDLFEFLTHADFHKIPNSLLKESVTLLLSLSSFEVTSICFSHFWRLFRSIYPHPRQTTNPPQESSTYTTSNIFGPASFPLIPALAKLKNNNYPNRLPSSYLLEYIPMLLKLSVAALICPLFLVVSLISTSLSSDQDLWRYTAI